MNLLVVVKHSRVLIPEDLDDSGIHGFAVLCNSLNRVPKCATLCIESARHLLDSTNWEQKTNNDTELMLTMLSLV